MAGRPERQILRVTCPTPWDLGLTRWRRESPAPPAPTAIAIAIMRACLSSVRRPHAGAPRRHCPRRGGQARAARGPGLPPDAPGAPPDSTSGDQKSVLILLTGQPGLPAASAVAAGIRSKLVSVWSTRITIETEHVDVARFKGTDYEHHLRALYRFKYAGRPFDAIVVAGNEPLGFLLPARASRRLRGRRAPARPNGARRTRTAAASPRLRT